MELVKLEQGSAAWLEYRKKMLNASEAPAVMGVNPWFPKNPAELFDLKMGLKQVEDNPFMRRGRELEPKARACFEIRYGEMFEPAAYMRGHYSASLDGINSTESEILEIKCPESLDKWTSQLPLIEVAPHYFWQLVHQMYVCYFVKEAHFVVFDGSDILNHQVFRRDFMTGYFDTLISRWEQFREYLDDNVRPPKGLDPVDCRFEEYVKSYKSALQELELAKETVDTLRDVMVDRYGEIHAKGIKIQRIERKGSIDYKHPDILEALANLDLEDYRKLPSRHWVIRKDK